MLYSRSQFSRFAEYALLVLTFKPTVDMRLHEFLAIIENEDKLIDFLIQHRIIRDKMACPCCGSLTKEDVTKVSILAIKCKVKTLKNHCLSSQMIGNNNHLTEK